jgi:hypothetical protein
MPFVEAFAVDDLLDSDLDADDGAVAADTPTLTSETQES